MMHKCKQIVLAMTLLVGSLTISGCATESQKIAPVKPTLESVKLIDNNVCFSKQDATKLGLYILELERGY